MLSLRSPARRVMESTRSIIWVSQITSRTSWSRWTLHLWTLIIIRCSSVLKIYTIAKRRYDDSLEPLHLCEHPGERADNDWFKVKCLAEILLEEAKGGR